MDQKFVVDQLGHPLTLSRSPQRIISLVPSQTELLANLDLSIEIVGITKFCIHPKSWFESKTKIGGTKQFNFDLIKELNPDLILGNKEENYKEGIEKLRSIYPVWMSDIQNLEDALSMIRSVASLVGKETKGESIIASIQKGFQNLIPAQNQSVLYMIWRKPWMAAGTNTFIHDMLSQLNLKNVATADRYPEISALEIKDWKPDLIFLSSEPYPFKEDHAVELKRISPSSKIILVDGEMFSWYGSRLIYSPAYFNSLALS